MAAQRLYVAVWALPRGAAMVLTVFLFCQPRNDYHSLSLTLLSLSFSTPRQKAYTQHDPLAERVRTSTLPPVLLLPLPGGAKEGRRSGSVGLQIVFGLYSFPMSPSSLLEAGPDEQTVITTDCHTLPVAGNMRDSGAMKVFPVLDTPLGKGGCAEVFASWYPERGPVAVKRTSFAEGDDLIVQEAGTLLALQTHPGIPEVYALRRVYGVAHMVMELVRGCTLQDKIRAAHGRLSSQELRTTDEYVARFSGSFRVLLRACGAIAHAHGQGTGHFDLKPPNVMVSDDEEKVKVMDWATARPTDQENPGIVIGTPAYMSPEQARGEALTERTDVYGLGTILYSILTNKAPHGHSPSRFPFLEPAMGECVPVRERNPRIPEELARVCECALHRDPGRRFPIVTDFAGAVADSIRPFLGASAMQMQDPEPVSSSFRHLYTRLLSLCGVSSTSSSPVSLSPAARGNG